MLEEEDGDKQEKDIEKGEIILIEKAHFDYRPICCDSANGRGRSDPFDGVPRRTSTSIQETGPTTETPLLSPGDMAAKKEEKEKEEKKEMLRVPVSGNVRLLGYFFNVALGVAYFLGMWSTGLLWTCTFPRRS